MRRDDNEKITSDEALTMKVKVDQLDRSLGHHIATTSTTFRVIATFVGIVSLMASLLVPVGILLWNTLSGVGQSVTEVGSEIENLEASLGETPYKLEQLLEDFERLKVELDGHVRRMERTQEKVSELERKLEGEEVSLVSVLRDVGDIKEALQLDSEDPGSKQLPRSR